MDSIVIQMNHTPTYRQASLPATLTTMSYLDVHDPATVSFWTTSGKVQKIDFLFSLVGNPLKGEPHVLEGEKKMGKLYLPETEGSTFEEWSSKESSSYIHT